MGEPSIEAGFSAGAVGRHRNGPGKQSLGTHWRARYRQKHHIESTAAYSCPKKLRHKIGGAHRSCCKTVG